MLDEILQSLAQTRRPVGSHADYPGRPGVYALALRKHTSLADFGGPGRVLYVGIAKESLRDRDMAQHFADRRTGSSTLRRSLGAILKHDLSLVAIPRGVATDKHRCQKYRFDDDGERKLTKWMMENLELGYWCAPPLLSYDDLRDNELTTIMELHPTLDLDRRTRRYNPLADRLTELRRECQREASLYTHSDHQFPIGNEH